MRRKISKIGDLDQHRKAYGNSGGRVGEVELHTTLSHALNRGRNPRNMFMAVSQFKPKLDESESGQMVLEK